MCVFVCVCVKGLSLQDEALCGFTMYEGLEVMTQQSRDLTDAASQQQKRSEANLHPSFPPPSPPCSSSEGRRGKKGRRGGGGETDRKEKMTPLFFLLPVSGGIWHLWLDGNEMPIL